MSIEIKVPNLPESVSDATIAKWHKKAGDRITRDENLVDLETDKVVLEVPAPASGILKEIQQAEGETVTEGQLLGILEEGEVEQAPASEEKEQEPAPDAPASKTSSEPAPQPSPAPAAGTLAEHKDLPPAARRLAAENDVNPQEVEGTGRGGRVTKGDVLAHIKGGGARPEERVKMSRLRARIAERMKEAQNTAAILT